VVESIRTFRKRVILIDRDLDESSLRNVACSPEQSIDPPEHEAQLRDQLVGVTHQGVPHRPAPGTPIVSVAISSG